MAAETQIESAFSDEQLHVAARLYYIDQLPQTEIARRVNVSQAKVSRLLSLARERGIVRISVAEYQPRHLQFEEELQKQFALKAICVVKTDAHLNIEDLRQTVAHFSTPFLTPLISAHHAVAVAGGRAMRHVISALKPAQPKPALKSLQAMGNIDSGVGPYDALELARTIAQRWSGSLLMLNTPAFVPDRKTRDTFVSLPQIKQVKQALKQAELALVGIGTLDNSVFIERRILGKNDITALKRSGAIGEICGRFYDARGRECETPWRDRVISIGWDELRSAPDVVAVVVGSDRSEALAAAIRGGTVKSLVIDQQGAAALLQFANRPQKPD